MSITSEDIKQQGFERAMRGYDLHQVDAFLDHVADEIDALNNENAQLRKELAAAKAAPAVTAPQPAVAAAAPADATELTEAKAQTEAAQAKADQAQQQVSELSTQLAAAEVTISDLQKKLAEKEEDDATISAAFISAQRAADTLKEEARVEGARIYRESEGKARELIREALVEKQRILDETDALTASCDKFRSQYIALLEHFSAEAETHFSDVEAPYVPEAAIDASMPNIPDAEEEASEAATSAMVLDDDLDIDEID